MGAELCVGGFFLFIQLPKNEVRSTLGLIIFFEARLRVLKFLVVYIFQTNLGHGVNDVIRKQQL